MPITMLLMTAAAAHRAEAAATVSAARQEELGLIEGMGGARFGYFTGASMRVSPPRSNLSVSATFSPGFRSCLRPLNMM
jgi:hypothetical protein